MDVVIQHILVLAIVGACAWVVLRHGLAWWRGKVKGCGPCDACGPAAPPSGKEPPKRIAFLPADMLRKRA
jgi:hypothetical protein